MYVRLQGAGSKSFFQILTKIDIVTFYDLNALKDLNVSWKETFINEFKFILFPPNPSLKLTNHTPYFKYTTNQACSYFVLKINYR